MSDRTMQDSINIMPSKNSELFAAIDQQDVPLLIQILAAGADPNAVSSLDNNALHEACDSWHEPEKRFQMVQALLDAGADPTIIDKDGGGPLFAAVIAKDTRVIELLLSRGADPNKEHDLGETLYDWSEFDYRFDEYDLNLPEEPTEADKATEEAWLEFLSKLALKYGKRSPDYLIALRRAGAMTGCEKWKAPGTSSPHDS